MLVMPASSNSPTNLNPIVDPIGPMEVARLLGCRYQKARDLMLSGKLGPTHYEDRKLTCSATAVIEFDRKRHLKATG
jgi:hypothetical protein